MKTFRLGSTGQPHRDFDSPSRLVLGQIPYKNQPTKRKKRSQEMLGFLKRLFNKLGPGVYGLDHAVLNVPLPPSAMWMNMGYWEGLSDEPFNGLTVATQHTSDFPEACQALLNQVLTMGLLAHPPGQPVQLVDVGCGCGDQSLYLMGLRQRGHSSSAAGKEGRGSGFDSTPQKPDSALLSDPELRPRHGGDSRHPPSRPLIDSYIGITLEPAQAALARHRLQDKHSNPEKPPAEVFCADASNPDSWTGDLQHSITTMTSTAQTDHPSSSTWLLALDCMYHFRPSRLPLLSYAHSTLHASLMAFDLVVADNASWFDRLLLCLVCWVTGAPFTNFVSGQEYRRLLVAAGYDPAQIQIRDISRHVFAGMAAFLDRRVVEAKPFGMKMGKFGASRMVFDWWARSGVVRGWLLLQDETE
ncbi:hypothetical protein NUU61_009759 [Penicillium alfredii]|uniref:Uncharacterized protein n=1 Tax=Penicillium alfredii TaxID=1506179 RepID=A0A9W9JTX1_9EURO|nr:uncharacterized protein NUU61_009759 [Penicillium alfredii]KAJ5081495.1 hypothetical protein NUU61_009759 [Penicillium alfredii]